jgi:hypothetical protein
MSQVQALAGNIVTSEVEERIHKALKTHPLEQIEDGYRLVHPTGTGVSTLRLLPVNGAGEGHRVTCIAQIATEYNSIGFPTFHPVGIQRLNMLAVHGAYHLSDGKLRQTAQFSVSPNETAVHLVVQSILNAFGGQLAIGRSIALATTSGAMLEQQRAHHAMPREWKKSLDEESLKATAEMLRERRLAASNGPNGVWAEIALSGDCPSRAIDPQAQTALLQVNVGMCHPIAGVGYLSTLSLPLAQAPPDSAEICRRLNALELEQSDFAPRLGAWGLQGSKELPGYCCFIPCSEPIPDLHTIMMWWSAIRAAWLRDRYWVANEGITLDALSNGKKAKIEAR